MAEEVKMDAEPCSDPNCTSCTTCGECGSKNVKPRFVEDSFQYKSGIDQVMLPCISPLFTCGDCGFAYFNHLTEATHERALGEYHDLRLMEQRTSMIEGRIEKVEIGRYMSADLVLTLNDECSWRIDLKNLPGNREWYEARIGKRIRLVSVVTPLP